MGVAGVFREVVSEEELAFTGAWEGDSEGPLVSVTFKNQVSAREIVLTHTGLSSPESREYHNEGRAGALDKLSEFVS